MIFDLLRDVPDPSTSADICIVGAGAAGIALAVECVRHGKRVTLLEAGGEATEDTAHDSYRGTLGGQAYRGMQEGRAKRLGGTTTLWGGQILELDASDFEQRPWVAGSGWPLRKEELTRHYARALELEGVASAVQADHDVWQRLKVSEPAFDDLDLYLSRWCPEPNFARLHRATLEGPAVSVWLHAAAIEAECEGEQVRGIRVRSASGRRATFRAAQYVFCLGAIESARFFLQPHERATPWSESKLVGCFFQDHIDSNAATIEPTDAAGVHSVFDTIFFNGFKYSPKLKLTEKAQRVHRLLNVGATVFSTEADGASLNEVKAIAKDALHGRMRAITMRSARTVVGSAPHLARQAYRYAVQHRAYHSPDAQLHLRVHCEQQPCGASVIRLADDRDAFGMLRARVCWAIAPQEIASIRCFVELAQRALAPYGKVVPQAALLRDDDSFAGQCEDSFHHMGGMRMDPSASRGVVDTNLKVHGTANCYVCSAAVYPSSGFSNPTHTLLALTVRLAEHLAC